MENLKLQEVSEKISLLKAENEKLSSTLNENRDVFKKWLTEKFRDTNYDGSYVRFSDDVNEYSYTMEEGDNEKMLRLKKTPYNNMPRGFGWEHPMKQLLFSMGEQQLSDKTEYVYENNYQPKLKNRENIFDVLKEDLLNSGEISNTIKKYINEDRKMRIDCQERMDVNSKEIRQLEQENRKALLEKLKNEFTIEKITELFENKTTIVNGEKYSLQDYDCNTVKSITFKKQTSDKYYLELVYKNNDEDTIKRNKKDFDISDYIKY